jgi:hypothetical protein
VYGKFLCDMMRRKDLSKLLARSVGKEAASLLLSETELTKDAEFINALVNLMRVRRRHKGGGVTLQTSDEHLISMLASALLELSGRSPEIKRILIEGGGLRVVSPLILRTSSPRAAAADAARLEGVASPRVAAGQVPGKHLHLALHGGGGAVLY